MICPESAMKSAAMAFFAASLTGLALAEPEPASKKQDANSVAVLPDSFARQQFKLLSKETLDELTREGHEARRHDAVKTQRTRNADNQPALGNVQQLDLITVYGIVDPEDYVAPKLPPMLAFRAKLDKQRPRTPKEITQGLLCVIGFCLIDTSKEPSIADRNNARAKAPPSFGSQR